MSSKVTGLVSGFDTQSIVESFMAIEKIPMDKLEYKKESADVKLQAYQAVNTYLMKFRTSMNTLASKSLWNSKAAVSTNEKAIVAKASEYAVNGSYSYKVAQLATSTQYMSKGFASKNTALVKQEIDPATGKTPPPENLGSISLSSGKARVDNSAELEDLNGGKGVYRGSVRVTDAAGTTSTIDLSSCVTMDDVVMKLNESTGAQISAYLKEGRLMVEDASGGSKGALKITNVGTGTTATDLGIVGAGNKPVADGDISVIEGRNVYIMGNNTSLSELNDGLGVETGPSNYVSFRISAGNGSYYPIDFNMDGCETVGDIVKRLNDTLDAVVASDAPDPTGGMHSSELAGLRFAVSEDGTSFALNGVKEGFTYQFYDDNSFKDVRQTEVAKQLGLTEKGAFTVTDDSGVINYDRVFGGVNSPMLKNLSGANGQGIGSSTDPNNLDNYIPIDFNNSTPLSAMNQGKGLNYSSTIQFMVYEGGKYDENGKAREGVLVDASQFLDPLKVAELVKEGKNVGDLVKLINDELEEYGKTDGPGAAAIAGMKLDWTTFEGKDVLTWKGSQAGYEYEVGGVMAFDLGLTRMETLGGTLGMQTGPIYDDDGNVTGGGITQKEGETNEAFADRQALYDAVQNLHSSKTDLIQAGSTFLDSKDATLGLLAANFAGVAKEQPQYQKTDENGDPVVDDDGDPVYDEELWLADCEKVLNGELMDDGFGNLIAGKGPNSLDNILSGSFTMEVGGETFSVDWADVLTECTKEGKSFSDISVDSFLEATNDAIASSADAAGVKNGIPQLGVDSGGKGFAWSGFGYASGDIKISGGGMREFGLDRDTSTDQILHDFMTKPDLFMLDDNLMTPPYLPMVPGKSGITPIDASNANTLMSKANLGFGMDLESISGTSIDIQFGEYDPKADPDISIKVDDIIAALKDIEPDSAKWTLQDYVNALNTVTEEELKGFNGDSGEDPVSFEWGFVNGGLGMTNTEGFTEFGISGDATKPTLANMSPVGISGTVTGEVNESGKFAQVGVFNVPYYDPSDNDFDGLGTIDISLGNGEIVTLSTSGLTTESTLADLIDKLNSELDKLADGSHPDAGNYSAADLEAFADIRFTLNGSGTGLAIDNTSNKTLNIHDTKDGKGASKSALAHELGFIKEGEDDAKVEAYSFSNAGSLGRDYVSRATDLEEWIGTGAEKGGMRITDSSGKSFNVDMSECETLGDVVDAINMYYRSGSLAVYASINETGDGIVLEEDWSWIVANEGWDRYPDPDKRVDIQVEDTMGGCVGQKLGLSGKGKTVNGQSVIDAKFTKTIDVMTTDTLEDVMYRISEAGYKAAIINDGKSYRLTVSSNSTGKENDFVIETDIEMFDFNQTQRARDAKVLYGDPNSTSSPIMLSSTTNTNSTAILGLSLEMKQVSDEWATITVDTDKDKVVEEITGMAQAYNDLVGIISMLDGYDSETGEKGILFGDSTVRKMMEEIDSFFYQIYDPYGLGIGGMKDGKQATWTWADMGIKLTAAAANTDALGNGSSWYSGMEVDTEKLESMVSSNWEVLSGMLYGERNAAAANAGTAAGASASFNGALEEGYDQVSSAINGDSSKSGWGLSNGIKGADTIANGSNSYAVIFNQPTTVTRMNLIFPDSKSSLKDYDIEYMDPVTGKWEKLRSIDGNASDANYLSVTPPKEVAGMRIVASSTNAEDGTFQLVDFQIFEEIGLASQLNQTVNALSDTRTGFLATQTNEITANIADINDQMSRIQNRMDAKEASLWRKFNAMEQALAQLQNQSSYFSSMMGSSEK